MSDGKDLYGGKSARDVAFYTPATAGRILRVSPATIATWAFGRPFETRGGEDFWPSLIEPADPVGKRLSFRNLVELYVLSVLRGKDGRASLAKVNRVRIDKIREGTRRLGERIHSDHPLADWDVHTDWVDLYADFFGELERISDAQQPLRGLLEPYLLRIDRDEAGLARRLYPPTREQDGGPRTVIIDPVRRFGRPVLARVNIETSTIADRVLAGDEPPALARDLDITETDVNEAVAFERMLTRAA